MRECSRAGIVAPFSGPRRAWGELLQRAAARRDDIGWIEIDDEGRAELGAACARGAIAAGAVAVVGHFNSGGAARALPEYARAGVACLLPLATEPGLTDLAPGLVLRHCPTDDDEGRALIDALGGDDVAVLDDASAYGRGLAERITAAGATRIDAADATVWRGGLVVSGVHRAAAELARKLGAAGCSARLAFVDDCAVAEFADLAGDAARDAVVADFPGGGQACVDALVDALADALTAGPSFRGGMLVDAVRASGDAAYDARGERIGAAWDVRPVRLAAERP